MALIAASHNTVHEPLLIRAHNTIIIPENSPLRTQLHVEPVVTSTAPHIVVFPGIIEADQISTVNILPPLTGHLIQLNATIGDEVKKDQVLGEIQSSGLVQAYADKLKAQSALKQVQEALNRAQKVNRAGANAVKDIEQIQNNYTQAQAELQRALTTLESLGTNKESLLQIKAPIDGMITALNYGIGSYINDVTLPLFTLSNTQAVWVTACIPENTIALVAKGQEVTVFLTAYPKQSWRGTISFINNTFDPDTRCNKTRIAFTNTDAKLQPNMFAAVHTQIPQEAQVIVPLSAILMNNDTTSVYVETKPWTFKRQVVVLGAEDHKTVRITSGLKAGDRVVTAGGILVND